MNPNQVKRRENWGLCALVAGAVLSLCGLLSLFVSLTVAAAGLAVGIALAAAGGVTLRSIPDLVHTPDESY